MKVRDRRFPLFLMSNPIRRLFFPPRKLVSQYVSKGMVIVDAGCGPGYFTLPIAEIVGPEGKVYAVDFDAKPVNALKLKAARNGYTNIEAHVSSAANLDFIPSGSVNFVLAHGLLCCMVNHAGAIAEISRILKPDGSAYLSVTKNPFGRKDPRHVSKQEWRTMLDAFHVSRQGEGLTRRWASVAPRKNDRISVKEVLKP